MPLQADRAAAPDMPPGPNFWRQFADHTWERASQAFPNIFPAPPVPPEMAFDAAVGLASAAREGRAVTAPCVWFDGRKQADPLPHLPRAADGSFEAFADRLLRETGAREFTALFPEIHCYSPRLLRIVRQILREITAACGLPAGWSDTALFVGQYTRTPFGVHDGPMSVLTLPVIGSKTFRLWSAEEIAEHPELVAATEYDPAASRSKRLNAMPGGMIYWPAREWHIAEADGGLTAALSFGFWTAPGERHPLRQVVSMAERLLAATAGGVVGPQGTPLPDARTGVEGQLPLDWAQRLTELSDMISSGLLETELVGEHLRQASAFGLKHLPTPMPARISRTAPVTLDPLAGMSVARRDSTLLVAVVGQVFSLPADQGIERLISELRGGPLVFRDLSAWFPSGPDDLSAEDGWAIIEHLARLGAVVEARR